MWTKEQKQAIDKDNSNILVAASAGSGKTAVLVERVITKVIKYRIDIDKILVVTFTNAAAQELKERLMLAIYKALNENPKDKFLKKQLVYINRASITTIHSFCLEIIRSNFHVLDIDPNFSICDETESAVLKSKAILKVLEDEYTKTNQDESIKSKLYNLLELFGGKDENLIEYILKIYSYIKSFAFEYEWLEGAVKKYNIENVSNLYLTDYGKNIYDSVIGSLEILTKKTEEIINEIRDNEDFLKYTLMFEEDKKNIMNCILNSQKNWDILKENLDLISFKRAPIYKGDNIQLKERIVSFRNNVLKKEVEKFKKNVYAPTSKILEDQKKAYNYVLYIYELILKFDEIYSNLKKEKNYIDFNDIEHLALNLLVKKDEEGNIHYTDVSNNLKEKFKEVYTDEYQDISFIQEAILESVSNENNRFMVGDIKQSIYKFRQAMPEIFNEKYDKYENIYEENEENKNSKNVKIILAKNFRSRKEVLDSINYIFKKIMSKEMGDCDYSKNEVLQFGAISYEDNKALDYSTEINIIDLKKDEDKKLSENIEEGGESQEEYLEDLKKFEIEAIFVAKKIKEIVGKAKTYNIKKNKMSNTKYKDIVILLRSIKDKGTILEETLKKYNIPVFCDVSTNLFESDEIHLLISLLKIIDNPYQDIEMISVLYSIIGRFSLDELIKIRSIDRKAKMYDNLFEAKKILEEKVKNNETSEAKLLEKINRFMEVLENLTNFSKINLVSTLLLEIYDKTNIYRQYVIDKNSAQKKANLNLLVSLAIKCEENKITSLNEYIIYIKNLKDKTDASTSSAKIIGENEDVVRIMTIHKSKGLEFSYVFLCDTSKKYNMLDTTALVTMHHNLGLGINIVDDEFKVSYPSVIKEAIKAQIIKETKNEELRMLYVALTRAKEKLYIYAVVNDYEKFSKKQIPIYKGNRLEPLIVENNNSYFENINMALKDYDNSLGLFNINVINAYENINANEEKEEDKKLSLKSIFKNKIKNKEHERRKIENEKSKLKEVIGFKYKYQDEINVPSRVTVSLLKKQDYEMQEDVQNVEYINEIKINKLSDLHEKYNLDEVFCVDTEKYSSAKKGTLIHFVLENINLSRNYEKESLKNEIEKLVKMGKITKIDTGYININKILTFLKSDLGTEIRNSKFVKKEQEFILKEESISKSVIQGIIDLYYVNENGNIVLVDFKTDRIDEEELFRKKYKKQLEIYKIALEKITGKKVENSYIYSFNLNKKISII